MDDSKNFDIILSRIGFGPFNVIFVMIAGFIQSCDAVEMLVLAFLGPLLSCAWNITVFEQSFLTTSVFIGMMIGGPGFGKLCDIYGRKSILIISASMLTYIGFLCSLAPTIVWILIFRAIIGALLGGIMSSLSTLISETMPMRYRGELILFMFLAWPVGSIFVTTLCYYIVPLLGWRAFLAIASLPFTAALLMILWLPESPRYMLLQQRNTEAIGIINKIAKWNNSEPITEVNTPEIGNYSIMDLIHPNYRLTTCLCMMMWFCSGLNYYGIVLFVTIVADIPHRCLQDFTRFSILLDSKGNDTQNNCCNELTWSNFEDTYISTAGEILFLFVTLLMLKYLSRKWIFAVYSISTAICFFVLNFCMSRFLSFTLLFVLRGSISSIFNLNYIYTSEVFPTSVRSLGIGVCNGSARIGAMIAPFIVNIIIMRYSFLYGTLIFAANNLIFFVCSIALPYETKGRKLYQTAQDPIEIKLEESHNTYEKLQ